MPKKYRLCLPLNPQVYATLRELKDKYDISWSQLVMQLIEFHEGQRDELEHRLTKPKSKSSRLNRNNPSGTNDLLGGH